MDQDDTKTPPPPRVGRLSRLSDVRLELRRVYVDARVGRIDTKDASRLAHVLQVLTRVMEVELVEQRLQALEDRVGVPGEKPLARSGFVGHA